MRSLLFERVVQRILFFCGTVHQQVRLEDGSAEWKFIMQVRTTSPLLGRLNPATLVANAQDMLDRAETQRREIDAARAKEGLLQVRQEDVDLTVVEDFLMNIRRKHNVDRHGSHEGFVVGGDEKLDADGGGGGSKAESQKGDGVGNSGGGGIESIPAAPARASRSNSSSSSSSIVEAVEAAAAASVDGAEIPNHAAILARIEMLEAKEGVRVVYVAIAHWSTPPSRFNLLATDIHTRGRTRTVLLSRAHIDTHMHALWSLC